MAATMAMQDSIRQTPPQSEPSAMVSSSKISTVALVIFGCVAGICTIYELYKWRRVRNEFKRFGRWLGFFTKERKDITLGSAPEPTGETFLDSDAALNYRGLAAERTPIEL